MHKYCSIYEELLYAGYSKQEIDLAVHKFVLWERMEAKRIAQDTITFTVDPYPVTPFVAPDSEPKPVIGHALPLLNIQFAKKPKNPV